MATLLRETSCLNQRRICWFTMGLLCLLAFLTNAQETPNEATVIQKEAPAWVQIRHASYNPQTDEAVEGTARYILVDRQDRPSSKEIYKHNVTAMLSETGVEEHGTIQVYFSPDYQELHWHTLSIQREGETLDRLNLDEFRMLHQEEDLNRNIYHGNVAATIFLKDLRVGDVLDYSYTLVGENPAFGDHWSGTQTVGWASPVDEQFYRLIWEKDTPLFYSAIQTEVQPNIQSTPTGREFTWSLQDTTALPWEGETPASYSPVPKILWSDYTDWKEVVEWGIPFYPETSPMNESMKEQVDAWIASSTDAESRALAAIDFVQDQIRYLGIEIGSGSYVPTSPPEVLNLRYGDCKDKSYLLVSFLRAMNIDAWPVLVSYTHRSSLQQQLPSPKAFDHVIVLLRIDENDYWIDPTRGFQEGKLLDRGTASFGYGLVLREGETDLTPIHRSRASIYRETVEDLFVLESESDKAYFQSKATYQGSAADRMRRSLDESGVTELGQTYLQFYQRYWPDIESAASIKVNDDTEFNRLEITESYNIPNFWTEGEGEDRRTYVYPFAIQKFIDLPDVRQRTQPLAISHPIDIRHNITLKHPDAWPGYSETLEVKHAAFDFKNVSSTSSNGKTSHLQYHYQSHTNSVAPSEVASYLEKIQEVDDLLGDEISHPENSLSVDFDDLHWNMLIASAIYSVVCTGMVIFLIRLASRMVPKQVPTVEDPSLTGLGGWLILVGIGIVVAPLGVLATYAEIFPVVFSTEVWADFSSVVSTETGLTWHAVIIFENFGNITLFIGSITIMYLYFSKHRLFPKMCILFWALSIVFVATDDYLSQLLPLDAFAEDEDDTTGYAGHSVSTLFWSCYLLRSKRVKQTFVN